MCPGMMRRSPLAVTGYEIRILELRATSADVTQAESDPDLVEAAYRLRFQTEPPITAMSAGHRSSPSADRSDQGFCPHGPVSGARSSLHRLDGAPRSSLLDEPRTAFASASDLRQRRRRVSHDAVLRRRPDPAVVLTRSRHPTYTAGFPTASSRLCGRRQVCGDLQSLAPSVRMLSAMAYPSPRSIALALALVWTAGSTAVLAGKTASDTNLTVGVTIDPTCTIAVTAGEWSADEAVEVDCRNLPDSHPDPLVHEALATGSGGDAMTVVINF
jgi:hypothetical protein